MEIPHIARPALVERARGVPADVLCFQKRAAVLQRVQERLNYRISLNNLGQASLGEPKSADGLQALQWWKEGRYEEIAAYCRKDVDLTHRLYLFGLREGYLLFSNKAGQRVRVPVDFRKRP